MAAPIVVQLDPTSRIWLLVVMLPIIFFGLTLVEASAQTTTIYLVRHAEKAGSGDAPLLDPEGFERAEALAHTLQDAELTAIFTSALLRTQQTAKPTADATCLHAEEKCIIPQIEGWKTIVDKILADHSNRIDGRVLIVGHSDTVDKIIEGLLKGVPNVADFPELNSDQFDRLFVIHRVGTEAFVETLRYGAPSP